MDFEAYEPSVEEDPHSTEDTPDEADARARAERLGEDYLNWGEAYELALAGEENISIDIIERDGEEVIRLKPESGYEWVNGGAGSLNYAVQLKGEKHQEKPVDEAPKVEAPPAPPPEIPEPPRPVVPPVEEELQDEAEEPREMPKTRKERLEAMETSLDQYMGLEINIAEDPLEFSYIDEKGRKVQCRLSSEALSIGGKSHDLEVTPDGLTLTTKGGRDIRFSEGRVERVKLIRRRGRVQFVPVGFHLEGKIDTLAPDAFVRGAINSKAAELRAKGIRISYLGEKRVSIDADIGFWAVPASAYLSADTLFSVVENGGGLLGEATFDNQDLSKDDPGTILNGGFNFNVA